MVTKCVTCGATLDYTEGARTAVCTYCQNKNSLSQNVDQEIASLYERVSDKRKDGHFDEAIEICGDIIKKDNREHAAYWLMALCRYGIQYVEDGDGKYKPTLNRMQANSIYDDKDYESAKKYADDEQKKVYEEAANEIFKIEREYNKIKQEEDPYDIFICYKDKEADGKTQTQSYTYAYEYYRELTTKENYRVFFAPESIPMGAPYEPYIFVALQTARAMLVIGTSKEEIESPWVQNEWKRFLILKNSDDSKQIYPLSAADGSPEKIFPPALAQFQAYNLKQQEAKVKVLGSLDSLFKDKKQSQVDVNAVIAEATAKATEAVIKENNEKHEWELYEERKRQRQQFDEYQKKTEDLIRGISVNGGGANVNAMLERAEIAVRSGDWASVVGVCDRILDIDPKNAKAYLYKLFSQLKVRTIEALAYAKNRLDGYVDFNSAMQFADASMKYKLSQALQKQRRIFDLINKKERTNELINSCKQGYNSNRESLSFAKKELKTRIIISVLAVLSLICTITMIVSAISSGSPAAALFCMVGNAILTVVLSKIRKKKRVGVIKTVIFSVLTLGIYSLTVARKTLKEHASIKQCMEAKKQFIDAATADLVRIESYEKELRAIEQAIKAETT